MFRHVIYDAYKKEVARRAAVADKDKKAVKEKEKVKIEKKLPYDDLTPISKSARITERIANQNTFHAIADDFKFFNDTSDEFRENGEGTLLPLWKYNFAKAKRLSVTATQWSPKYSDLFAVGLGSYDFTRQGLGYLLLYTLKNPTHPCFAYETDVGVMCLDIHPEHSYMIAGTVSDNLTKKFTQVQDLNPRLLDPN